MHFKSIIIIINFLIIIHAIFIVSCNNHKDKYFEKDELTLVSAYYQMKSKHSHIEYLYWLKNILLLNIYFFHFEAKINLSYGRK